MKKKAAFIVLAMLAVSILPAYSQTNTAQKTVKLFFEKVYLHTDRQIYTPADDIWFKAYLVNAQDDHLLSTSKNLYVELISPGGKILLNPIIALNNGLGKGDLHLPDSLAAGNYRLRAYTNWMRNFGNNFIFERTLKIVDGKATPGPAPAPADPIIRFFPEGGSLVMGISSTVAVKAELPDGKAQVLKGVIMASQGDTVARFATDSSGMGSFTLLPLPGQAYKAKTTSLAKAVTGSLPAPLNNGLTLKILKKDTTLYAVISCNEASVPVYGPQTLSLKVRTFGRVTFQQTLQLKGNTAAVIIPTGQLPAGISSITLYDAEQKPNCERLVFVDHAPNINLSIKLNKPAYRPREQVLANVVLTDKAGNTIKSNFSMAAVDAGLVPADESNITAYLMLRSELQGDVANAARYFDTTNVQRHKQLDLLLLTQGWRDLVWKRLADTTLRIAYIPEQGLSLSGMVRDKNKATLPAANITLTAPDAKGRNLFWAKTDAQGKYYFDNLQLFGRQSVRLNSKDAKGKTAGTLTLDSLAKDRPAVTPSALYTLPTTTDAVNKAALVKQVAMARQRSLSDTLIRLKDVEVKKQPTQVLRDRTVTSFGYKDEVLTVKPEDEKYNTLRDYIQFASKQARVDGETNRLFFVADGKRIIPRFVVDNRDALFSDNDPADVIDMISNSYLDLAVSSVKQVVIKKLIGGTSLIVADPDGAAAMAATDRERFNANAASASALTPVFVIYLSLKPDAFKKPDAGSVKAEINGYYEARVFYKPVYNKPQPDARLDARPTLHWEPMAVTGTNGNNTISFYNSDSNTTVRIVVQGITDTGLPITAVKTYTVK